MNDATVKPDFSRFQNRLQLIGALTLRDLKVNYDRSYLGFLWTLVSPMLQLGVFYVVFHIILKIGGPSYPAYVFIGLISYGWFQSSAIAGCSAVIRSPELILRPEFPRWVLPLIPITVAAIQFILALPLAFLFAFLIGADFGVNVFWLPLIALLQAITMLPIAFVTAALNSHYRDVQQITQVITLLFFFLTPIFYLRTDIPPDLVWIISMNPMAYLVDAYRATFLGSAWPPLAHLFNVLLFIGLGTPLAVWLYSRMSYQFVEDM